MSRQRWFETLHPSVVLVYLVGVMGLGLCTLHPIYLGLMGLWCRGGQHLAARYRPDGTHADACACALLLGNGTECAIQP